MKRPSTITIIVLAVLIAPVVCSFVAARNRVNRYHETALLLKGNSYRSFRLSFYRHLHSGKIEPAWVFTYDNDVPDNIIDYYFSLMGKGLGSKGRPSQSGLDRMFARTAVIPDAPHVSSIASVTTGTEVQITGIYHKPVPLGPEHPFQADNGEWLSLGGVVDDLQPGEKVLLVGTVQERRHNVGTFTGANAESEHYQIEKYLDVTIHTNLPTSTHADDPIQNLVQRLNATRGMWVCEFTNYSMHSTSNPTQVVMVAAQRGGKLSAGTNDLRILEIRTVPLDYGTHKLSVMAALLECPSGNNILLFYQDHGDFYWTRFYDVQAEGLDKAPADGKTKQR